MWQLIRRATRDLRHLLTGLVIGLPAPAVLVLTLCCMPASVAAGAGVVLFLGTVWCTRQLAGLQRRRVALPGSPYRPTPNRPLAKARALVEDPATWRDLAWLLCQFVTGLATAVLGIGLWLAAAECLLAPAFAAVIPANTRYAPAVLELLGRSQPLTWLLVPVGAGLAIAAYHLPRHLLAAQTGLARWLLAPTATAQLTAQLTATLTARVDQLATTRAAAVDATAAELRRVERDLHDGAQMRLAALALHLGMAEDVLDADPASARSLLAEAKADAGTALRELRDLVRGIHPPILAERGLADAVHNLALASGIPVALDLRLTSRLAAPVESAVYFAIAESLANANRHSGARHINLTLAHNGTTLHVTVRDDGHGGANPAHGSGLRGIQHRLSTFDGTLHVTSPTNGPTVLEMELPCAS